MSDMPLFLGNMMYMMVVCCMYAVRHSVCHRSHLFLRPRLLAVVLVVPHYLMALGDACEGWSLNSTHHDMMYMMNTCSKVLK